MKAKGAGTATLKTGGRDVVLLNPTEELFHLCDTSGCNIMGPNVSRVNRLYRWRRWGVDREEKREWLRKKGVSHLCAQPVRESLVARFGRVRTELVPPDIHCLVEEKQPLVKWSKRETPDWPRNHRQRIAFEDYT